MIADDIKEGRRDRKERLQIDYQRRLRIRFFQLFLAVLIVWVFVTLQIDIAYAQLLCFCDPVITNAFRLESIIRSSCVYASIILTGQLLIRKVTRNLNRFVFWAAFVIAIPGWFRLLYATVKHLKSLLQSLEMFVS